jgi:hypothetical protein
LRCIKFVRAVLAILLIAAAQARAWACPRGIVCVATQTRAELGRAELASTYGSASRRLRFAATVRAPLFDDKRLALRWQAERPVRTRMTPREGALAESLRIHVVPRMFDGDIEMPWIWQALRTQVYSRMPTYQERRFTMTLSPVVVSSPSDTIPGVGIGGDF